MIDAYTHLDITVDDPIADLRMRLVATGLHRALVVETWDGANHYLLEGLANSPDTHLLLALCCRVESTLRPDSLLQASAVAALRIRCSQIADADSWLEAASVSGKWLLLHADAGIEASASRLIALAERWPALRIYLPHLGWPSHEHAEGWRRAVTRLSQIPSVIMGVSAIAHLSRQPFPHDDVRVFAEHVIDSFGQARVVSGSDYPLGDKRRYVDYIRLSRAWIEARFPSWGDTCVFDLQERTVRCS